MGIVDRNDPSRQDARESIEEREMFRDREGREDVQVAGENLVIAEGVAGATPGSGSQRPGDRDERVGGENLQTLGDAGTPGDVGIAGRDMTLQPGAGAGVGSLGDVNKHGPGTDMTTTTPSDTVDTDGPGIAPEVDNR
jgi:hypothetical protein